MVSIITRISGVAQHPETEVIEPGPIHFRPAISSQREFAPLRRADRIQPAWVVIPAEFGDVDRFRPLVVALQQRSVQLGATKVDDGRIGRRIWWRGPTIGMHCDAIEIITGAGCEDALQIDQIIQTIGAVFRLQSGGQWREQHLSLRVGRMGS